MRELSVAEQRYQAVLAVISDGATVTEVAARFGVARKTVHDWLAKYEAGGLENLGDRSHRPRSCPHQVGSDVEVAIARMRTSHPSWGRGGSHSSWPRATSSRCRITSTATAT
jgi:transposase-like protein